jgi:hypothetical protein
MLKFGAFELPQIRAVYGPPFRRLEKELQIDIDGAVGAGLLSEFRLTFSDGGRTLWVEQTDSVAPAGDSPPGLEPPGLGPQPGDPSLPPGGVLSPPPLPGLGTPPIGNEPIPPAPAPPDPN